MLGLIYLVCQEVHINWSQLKERRRKKESARALNPENSNNGQLDVSRLMKAASLASCKATEANVIRNFTVLTTSDRPDDVDDSKDTCAADLEYITGSSQQGPLFSVSACVCRIAPVSCVM